MRWVTLAAGAAIVVSAVSAQAADVVKPKPVVVAPVVAKPAPLPFNGPYLGLLAGYGWGKTSADAPVPPGNWNAPDIHPKGWLLGGTLGVNFRRDNLVVGAEGDIAWANIHGAGGWDEDDSSDNPWNSHTSALGTLRLRLGLASGNVLGFVTGGLAFQNTNVLWTYENQEVGPDQHFRLNPWGWTIGGGIEVAHSRNVSFKIEYLYANFGSKFEPTAIVSDEQGAPGVRFANDLHMVRFGINWHLN